MNGYLDEFFFRFNRRNFLPTIWHKLTERMMQHGPYVYQANATCYDNPINFISSYLNG
jgi:hypothetical protein